MELFLKFLAAFKEAGDTKTAIVIGLIAAFYLGTRIQKKIGSLISQEDFNHRLEQFTNAIQGTLSGFRTDLNKHIEHDDQRFSTIDDKQTGTFNNIYKQVGATRRSLARIEGKLQIEVPPEEKEPE